MSQTTSRNADAIPAPIHCRLPGHGDRTEAGNLANLLQSKIVRNLLSNSSGPVVTSSSSYTARRIAGPSPTPTTSSAPSLLRRDMSTLSTVEDVVDTERESHVSLLGGKYLLFSAPENNATAAVPGRKNFVKCVLIETREQFTCKVRGLIDLINFPGI